MLFFAIDVLVMSAVGILAVALAYAFCAVTSLTLEESGLVMASSAFTAMLMVIAYMVMANMLDMLVMA